MKFISNYVNDFIAEGRRPKNLVEATDAENVDVDDIKNFAVAGKKVTPAQAERVKAGKSATENGTKGVYAFDPPTPEDEAAWGTIKEDTRNNKNARQLASRFKSKHDFFVQGEAGWAKTDMITNTAKKAGYHVVTVYLDKAVATDLGGIPLPVKNEATGRTYLDYAVPAWAAVMLDNPDKKFLLFFDEMNQAAPDVLNALMPIVLKHEVAGIKFDNIIVGAAGNKDVENDSLSNINQPLEDRLKPYIIWETHTDAQWDSHFAWAHKKYDDTIGPEVIDKCSELREYWNSPRDVTRVIYDWCVENTDGTLDEPSDIKEYLDAVVWRNLDDNIKSSRTLTDKLEKFAQWLFDWAENGGKPKGEAGARKRSKGADQINADDKQVLIRSLVNGYFFNSKQNDPENGDDEKYVCTTENAITEIFDPELTGINAEVFRKILKEMEANGKKPKYANKEEAKEEAKQKGWLDPATGSHMGFLVKNHVNPAKVAEPKASKKHTDD